MEDVCCLCLGISITLLMQRCDSSPRHSAIFMSKKQKKSQNISERFLVLKYYRTYWSCKFQVCLPFVVDVTRCDINPKKGKCNFLPKFFNLGRHLKIKNEDDGLGQSEPAAVLHVYSKCVPTSTSNERREVSDMFGLFRTKNYKNKCLAGDNW